VNLISPFRLLDPEGQPIAIQGRRSRALLGYLLLAAQQGAGRERLAGLFWSDRTEAQARSSLRQCLLELRGALAEDAIAGASEEARTSVSAVIKVLVIVLAHVLGFGAF